MRRFLSLFLLVMLCLILASCNTVETDATASTTNNTDSVGNGENSAESNNNVAGDDCIIDNAPVVDNSVSSFCQSCQCQCDCFEKNSSIALLIAQTHFFQTVNPKEAFGYYYIFEIIEEPNVFVEVIEDEYWYIIPRLYQNGERVLFLGGVNYVYIIKKSTGEIADLLIYAGE